MVYGNFENPIVDETSNCEPLGIYAALKYVKEKLVVSYNQVFGLPYKLLDLQHFMEKDVQVVE